VYVRSKKRRIKCKQREREVMEGSKGGRTTMSVVGDEKKVRYRCSDEIGVGVRMRLLWKR
jgi:hypothetical protein